MEGRAPSNARAEPRSDGLVTYARGEDGDRQPVGARAELASAAQSVIQGGGVVVRIQDTVGGVGDIVRVNKVGHCQPVGPRAELAGAAES